MKKKKGFTLIELIGIVIILGVIVIIGVPSIMKILQSNKNKEYEVFEKNLFLAAETYVSEHIEEIDELKVAGGTYYVPIELLFKEKLINSKAKYNPLTKSNVADNAAVQVIVHDDLSYDYSLTTYDPVEEEPETPPSGGGTTTPTYTVYENGTAVYFNPVTGKFCSDYKSANSGNGVNSGCMKWYIFNDYKDAEKINLLLDHNTTTTMLFDSTFEPNTYNSAIEMDEINKVINNDMGSWQDSLNPRILSMMDLQNILDEDATTIQSTISFGKSSCNGGNYKQETLKPWLFDRTTYEYNWLYASCRDADAICTKCGASNAATGEGSTSCKVPNYEHQKNYFRGYLVGKYTYKDDGSVSFSVNRAIDYRGFLQGLIIGWYGYYGIRPVITIDKSLVSGNATPCSSIYSCDYCKTSTCGEYVNQ